LQLTNAEVKNVNVDDSTFNILLTFSNERQALLYCRVEGEVKAYNIAVMDGSCPCCLKPTCASIFAKRHELLKEARAITEFPSELVG
jgi:hypothetical protein